MIRIKLRELLWEKNLTATTVYKATGVSQSIISEIIHNKRVNIGLDIVNRLCLFLKCDINDLLEFIPEDE